MQVNIFLYISVPEKVTNLTAVVNSTIAIVTWNEPEGDFENYDVSCDLLKTFFKTLIIHCYLKYNFLYGQVLAKIVC